MSAAADTAAMCHAAAAVQSSCGLEGVLAAQHALLSASYDTWCVVDGAGRIIESTDLSYVLTSSTVPSMSLAGRQLQDLVADGPERARVERCLAEATSTNRVTKIQTHFHLADLAAPGAADAVCLPVIDAEISVKLLPGLGSSSGAVQLIAGSGMPWALKGIFVGVKVVAEKWQSQQERQQQPQEQQPQANAARTVPERARSLSMSTLDLEAWEELSQDGSSRDGLQPEDANTDTLSEYSHAMRASQAPSMTSAVRKMPRLCIKEVHRDAFAQEATHEVPAAIRGTVRRMIEVAEHASGGCSLAVAGAESWQDLRDGGAGDYQVVDRREEPEDGQASAVWKSGYMNDRIKGINCRSPAFLEAVREFSAHTEKDRWPEGHEAEGLPKDGFVALLGTEGFCLKSAVRLVGLPVPPFKWDRVGTRHYSALSLAWALRHTPSAVVVRSDSGSIHLISFVMTKGMVLKTHIDA